MSDWDGWDTATAVVDESVWIEPDPEPSETIDISSEHVTAVMVCHSSGAWLGPALTSLRTLERRPDRLLVVTCTSGTTTNDTETNATEINGAEIDAMLAAELEAGWIDRVITADPALGFGAAVQHALEVDPPPDTGGRRRWLWLLHDDIVATPAVLRLLLEQVVTSPSLAMTGPALIQPHRPGQPRRLSPAIVSMTSGARPVTIGHPDEIAQGQRDEPEDVLGLSTCGLLVRPDLLAEVGGFEPRIGIFLDGLELGWRFTAAGHRVAMSPKAELVHRRVGRAGLRRTPMIGTHPEASERALALDLVRARSGAPGPLVLLRLLLGGVLRALGLLLGKAPDRAADELRSLRSLRRPVGGLRERIQGAPSTDGGRAAAAALRPSRGRVALDGLERAAGALTDGIRRLGRAEGAVEFRGGRSTSSGDRSERSALDELTADEYTERDENRLWWRLPLGVVIGAVIAIGILIRFLTPGDLHAPQLLPAPDALSAAFARYTDPIAGAPGVDAPPWIGLLALASVVVLGQPAWLVTLLFCGSVGLTYWVARGALRTLGAEGPAVVVLAGLYALAPTALGGLQRGSLWVAVWALTLPLLVRAVARLLRRHGLEAWRGAFGTALAGAVLIAFAPLALLPAVAAVGIGLWRLPARRRPLLTIAACWLLLLIGWLPTLVRHPGRWLTGPDPSLVDQQPAGVPALLLGRTPGAAWLGGTDQPSWMAVFFVLCWLVGLAALALRGSDRVVRSAWLTALIGFGAAVGLSRVVVSVPPLDQQVRPELTGWLLLAFAGLIAAGARAIGSTRWLPRLQQAVAVVVALVVLGVGATWWTTSGAGAPMSRDAASTPAFMAAAQTTSGVRTLVVSIPAEGRADWALLSDDGLRTGDAERGSGAWAEIRPDLDRLVAQLVGLGSDEEMVQRLRQLGIAQLWVRGADAEVISRIGAADGIQAGTRDDRGSVWLVAETTSRWSLQQADRVTSIPPGVVPSDVDDATIGIGMPTDPRWRIEVAGSADAATTDLAGVQGFQTDTVGAVQTELSAPWQHVWAVVQLVVLLVIVVMAAPALSRPDDEDDEPVARRARAEVQ